MDLIWIDGRLLVAGPDTGPHLAAPAPGRSHGLRFASGTAPALLGVPAYELRDQCVPLDALWPADRVRRLTDQVADAPDRGAALESLTRTLAAGAAPPDPLAATVTALLDTGHTVAGTAHRVGLGPRQLHRRSLHAFGYGPKTLARVLRFQRALTLARAGVPLAAVAARVGCADQAHLAREVRELGGGTLGVLRGVG
jgi:AraC-like DNA-binding protein